LFARVMATYTGVQFFRGHSVYCSCLNVFAWFWYFFV